MGAVAAWGGYLDGKDERQRHERLLPAAQLLEGHRPAACAKLDAHLHGNKGVRVVRGDRVKCK